MFKRSKGLSWRPALIFFASVLALALALRPVPAAATPQSPYGPVGVEASPQIFAVMCALYASGFPATSAVRSEPGFTDLQARLLALHGPATEAMRSYYRAHVLDDPGATLSRYITFGLIAGSPPKFPLLLKPDNQPPDVLALDGFSEVLANFYKEAGIEQLWQQWEPVYNQRVATFIDPVARIAQLETGYLREAPPEMSRNFVVYVEPLVGALSNARNIGDHYAIVVNPTDDSLVQIRHTMLHFFLDPLPLRYADQIHPGVGVLRYAAKAPDLPEDMREDFSSYFTECLVRAVELRLRRLPAAEQAQEIDQVEGEGYVLVRPITAGLTKFEASEPSMTLYFPDLLQSINFPAELKRVQTLTFFPVSAQTDDLAETSSSARAQAKLNQDLQADLQKGERLIATQDAAGAQTVFEQVLQRVPGQPRAQYGLAVAYILQGDAAKARELFEQVVAGASASGAENAADALALAWSHVYLGRMSDLQGDRPKAIEQYGAVLAIAGAPDAARAAAQLGLQQPYQPAKQSATPQ